MDSPGTFTITTSAGAVTPPTSLRETEDNWCSCFPSSTWWSTTTAAPTARGENSTPGKRCWCRSTSYPPRPALKRPLEVAFAQHLAQPVQQLTLNPNCLSFSTRGTAKITSPGRLGGTHENSIAANRFSSLDNRRGRYFGRKR